MYTPYNNYYQPYNRLISVSGMNGAYKFSEKMPPNSADVVFDENEDIMYVIRTDGAGFPQVMDFDFTKREHAQDVSQYATKSDLEAMMARIEKMIGERNGEQLVRAEIIE